MKLLPPLHINQNLPCMRSSMWNFDGVSFAMYLQLDMYIFYDWNFFICDLLKQKKSHVSPGPTLNLDMRPDQVEWVTCRRLVQVLLDHVVKRIHRTLRNWKPLVNTTFCYKVTFESLIPNVNCVKRIFPQKHAYFE